MESVMLRYVLKRIGYLLITLFLASLFTFIILNALPGENAEILARHLFFGSEKVVPPEIVAEVSARYNLDKPLTEQYSYWIRGVLSGNLGYSVLYNKPVLNLLQLFLPPTILLTIVSMSISVIAGLFLGIYSALHQNKFSDHIIRIFTIFSISMPSFWIAFMLILVFSMTLNLTPIAGYGRLEHIILHALSLSIGTSAWIARVMRTSMLETLEKPFIIFAKAKGLPMRKVIYSHVVKNAILPVLSIMGTSFGSLLAGSVIIETIFSWPGIGGLLIRGITARDMVLVSSIIMIIVLMYLIVSLIVDISYWIIDSRIKYE
jgi:peptide/nickel transport system permease protein